MTQRAKNFKTAILTFVIALCIGFYVQHGDTVAARFVSQGPASPNDQPLTSEPASPSHDAALTPALDTWEKLAPMSAQVVPANLTLQPALVEPQLVACAVQMTAETLPMAFVALTVDAPCNANAMVTFHHQGMKFSEMTDADGHVSALVPALSETAMFMSAFEAGETAIATTHVPEIAAFERIVMQWSGTRAAQLHALEFGAAYGAKGHLWNASASEMDFLSQPQSGFFVSLGDETGAMAEIYSYPITSGTTGKVAISVELEVTARNCGQAISVQGIQWRPSSGRTSSDLEMTLPDCDAVGSYLVLKNMFKDLTVSAK